MTGRVRVVHGRGWSAWGVDEAGTVVRDGVSRNTRWLLARSRRKAVRRARAHLAGVDVVPCGARRGGKATAVRALVEACGVQLAPWQLDVLYRLMAARQVAHRGAPSLAGHLRRARARHDRSVVEFGRLRLF